MIDEDLPLSALLPMTEHPVIGVMHVIDHAAFRGVHTVGRSP